MADPRTIAEAIEDERTSRPVELEDLYATVEEALQVMGATR